MDVSLGGTVTVVLLGHLCLNDVTPLCLDCRSLGVGTQVILSIIQCLAWSRCSINVVNVNDNGLRGFCLIYFVILYYVWLISKGSHNEWMSCFLNHSESSGHCSTEEIWFQRIGLLKQSKFLLLKAESMWDGLVYWFSCWIARGRWSCMSVPKHLQACECPVLLIAYGGWRGVIVGKACLAN